MKCAECEKAGETSRVYVGMGMTTSMFCQPYYDEQGIYHHHDLNITTQSFSCSRGHAWAATVPNHCPSCDWKSG